MDPTAIAAAFLLGFASRQIGLPPLVGFLFAGFLLQPLGVTPGATIREIADLGVTLLLFTIGLKLKVQSLIRREVWGGATLHALITVLVFGLGLYGLALMGITVFADLDLSSALLVAFALSFSSTVFAVKTLEDKGEMPSLHGRTAIAILIMQDIFAVVFLTASAGKLPSPWAFGLIGLVFVRPVLTYFLDRVGHGELLPMFGLFAALALGVQTFELVGIKPDLGALILGMLMAHHKRASDIADSLFSFKEIFLVGFFLQIGLSQPPTVESLVIAVGLVLLVPAKVALFFVLLTHFNMRARSSLLASLSLANYSEFGLIVGGISVANGWMDGQWLVIIAMALAISFVVASWVNTFAHDLYTAWCHRLIPLETATPHPEERPISLGHAEVAIFGMGRIGTGAYDHIYETYGDILVGIDSSAEKVAEHQAAGRNVIEGDATDTDFWLRTKVGRSPIRLVMLAMPEHQANMYALEQITKSGYEGYIAALAQYPDRAQALAESGADVVYNTFTEAGTGFAARIDDKIRELTVSRLTGLGD